MSPRRRVTRWSICMLGLCWAQAAFGQTAWSQEGPPSPLPPLPRPAGGAPPAPTVSESASVEQLAKRLRAMEEMNKKLAEQLERTTRDHNEQMNLLLQKFGELSKRLNNGEEDAGQMGGDVDVGGPPGNDTQADDINTPVPDYQDGVFASPASDRQLPSIAKPTRNTLKANFGPGFQFQTKDEELRLQIHYESQVEGRVWDQSGLVPGHSGIFLPRQRIFFNGNITKLIEYEFSINRGLNNLNLLNAYINLNFDTRFELRFGRFFTPLTYDQYAISNYWLPTPERSLFTTNVGLGRQFGLMGWGYLFDQRLDYAAGIFNGSRNSFENFNNAVDFVAYLNGRPFQDSESFPFAKFLNVGTSVAFGRQDQSPVPAAFRIGGGSPDANIPGSATVPFLILNRDVIERGNRLLGSVHTAYFYKGLSLIGEWQYGYGSYATPGRPSPVQVPFSGFYVAGGYFLTGEHVERRTRVKPLRPLVPLNKRDERGLGAWELVGRVSQLGLGDEVFRGGFADPNLWSNRATTTELGVNWYLNEYAKIYIFWLRGDFADPVVYHPGRFQKAANMFWLRFQLYF